MRHIKQFEGAWGRKTLENEILKEAVDFAKQLGLKQVIKPVTSPQSKGMAESFVKTLKRDYVKLADRQDR